MNDFVGGASLERAASLAATPLGRIETVAGGGAETRLNPQLLELMARDADVAVAMAGEIGSMLKMTVAGRCVIGSVHALGHEGGEITARISFLGEGELGDEGEVVAFRRGVTRYPLPGTPVIAVSSLDMNAIFAAGDAPHIEIGTVHPTSSTRAALLIEAAPPSPDTERYVKIVQSLTRRQREVLSGVIEGLPNKLIAYRLGLSIRTVEGYRAAIMERTQAKSLSDLVRLGIKAGL